MDHLATKAVIDYVIMDRPLPAVVESWSPEPREMADCPGTRLVPKRTVTGGISLRNVSFVYPGTAHPVLSHIDVEVEPGETIALVGRS
jgi:ABC-type multidrug transport system fused ATPase/permease subunit